MAYFLRRRIRARPPRPSKAALEGSGTAIVEISILSKKIPPPLLYSPLFVETKTDPRTQKLTKQLSGILLRLPSQEFSPWVFPGPDTSKHIVNISKSWAAVLMQAGIEHADTRHAAAQLLLGGRWRACQRVVVCVSIFAS